MNSSERIQQLKAHISDAIMASPEVMASCKEMSEHGQAPIICIDIIISDDSMKHYEIGHA